MFRWNRFLYDQTNYERIPKGKKGTSHFLPLRQEYKDAGPNVNFPRIAKRRGLTGVIMHELCRNQQFIGWDEYGIAIKEWAEVIGRPHQILLNVGSSGICPHNLLNG